MSIPPQKYKCGNHAQAIVDQRCASWSAQLRVAMQGSKCRTRCHVRLQQNDVIEHIRTDPITDLSIDIS